MKNEHIALSLSRPRERCRKCPAQSGHCYTDPLSSHAPPGFDPGTPATGNTRLISLSQAPAGSQPRARKTDVYIHRDVAHFEGANDLERLLHGRPPPGSRGRACKACCNARKTATAPVLMTAGWVRAPSMGRTGATRALCEAARSAAADSLCLGSGSTAKTLVRPCIRRLSVVAGTARARCLRQLAAVRWAEVLPITTTKAGRALGPMLPASARERWPYCVLRDSCHSALPDQQVCRKSARDAGLVALTAPHAPSDLPLTGTA